MKEDVIGMMCYIENLEYESTDLKKLAELANTTLQLLNGLIPDKDVDGFEIRESIARLNKTIDRYLQPADLPFPLSADQFNEIKRHLLNDLRTFGIIDITIEYVPR